jgi:S-sulfo-L-cysteine synthase (3-phospho-L-serine-dependent)
VSGRRLLVLGAGDLRHAAFFTWARRQLEVVLVDGFSHERYERLVSRHHAWDVRDERPGSPALVRELAAEAEGVTTLSDMTLVTAAEVAQARGLPCPGPEAARLCRDKHAFRERLRAEGLAAPDFRLVTDADDLARFWRGRDRPAVLKPIDNGGSAGVFRVENAAEAVARWETVRSFSARRLGIVEELVEGPELSVEAAVRDGDLHVAAIVEKETAGDAVFIEREHLVPARLPPAAREQLVDATRAAVHALALGDCVVHAELKLRDDGPVLVELAPRPAGGLIPEVVRLATGVDLYAVQAALALGDPLPEPGPPQAPCAAVRFLVGTGTVEGWVPPAELLDGEGELLAVNQLYPAGTRLPPLVGNWARSGYAIAAGPDRDALRARLREAVTRLGRRIGVDEVEA